MAGGTLLQRRIHPDRGFAAGVGLQELVDQQGRLITGELAARLATSRRSSPADAAA